MTTSNANDHQCCTCCQTDNHDLASRNTTGSETNHSDIVTSAVELTTYRIHNLALNSIHILGRYEPLPQAQANLADRVCSTFASSPEPTIAEVIDDFQLRKIRVPVYDSAVHSTIVAKFGCWDQLDGRQCDQQLLMKDEHVPRSTQREPEDRPDCPKPNLLFKYSYDKFAEYGLGASATSTVKIVANGGNLVLPLLAMQLKGQWTSESTSLCVAENEVVASAAACIKMGEDLNHRFREMEMAVEGVKPLNSTSFAVVSNGTEARLFIAWTDGPGMYKMQLIRSYCLTEADQWVSFHRAVHNIFFWGYSERLDAIRTSFDIVFKVRGSQQCAGLKRHGDCDLESEARPPKSARLGYK